MGKQAVTEFLQLILIAFAIAFVIYIIIFSPARLIQNFHDFVSEISSLTDNQNIINKNLGNEIIEIPVSPRRGFSGFSREKIYHLRTRAVNTSPIFSQMDYQPNPAIYGGIVDNLPWISAYCALHSSTCTIENKGKGDTRDSVGILNPELLYYISLAEFNDKNFYKDYYFVPYRLTYNPRTKTITAYYKHEKNPKGTHQTIYLEDMNARDLGYNYAFMNDSYNVDFYEEYENNTLKTGVKELQGFYTHGNACKIPGGCNNVGPRNVEQNAFYLDDLPAKFNIKLWKNQPRNSSQTADINMEMIFE